jgi:ATP-dependent protease HslVU (ClpYQ) peptidase subunit
VEVLAMTVVAWDGQTLAADKQMGGDFPRTVTKLRRTAAGELLGVAGWMNKALILMDWFEAGADPATFPAFQRDRDTACDLIIVRPDRSVWSLTDEPVLVQLEDPHHSIGSGRDFAAAAMHLGCDARRAVEVAMALCGHCGNGIDTMGLA